ncbi:MAG: hypothetical protein ABIP48_12240 [Planctomycetota bacterium]
MLISEYPYGPMLCTHGQNALPRQKNRPGASHRRRRQDKIVDVLRLNRLWAEVKRATAPVKGFSVRVVPAEEERFIVFYVHDEIEEKTDKGENSDVYYRFFERVPAGE